MTSNKKIDLSLVIPCYNESSHLKKSFQYILKVLNSKIWNWEIIFVEDKSTDNTRELIAQIIQENPDIKIKKIFHRQNTGRGKAVADGIKISNGEIVGFIDIDLEVLPHYIPIFVQKILEEADVTIGYRVYKFHLGVFCRYIISTGYSALTRLLLKLPFGDTEAGYKFFRRSKILPLLDEIEDSHWFWDTECVTRAYAHNLKIVEIPVAFIRRPDKKSTVKIFKDSLYYLKKIFKLHKQIKSIKLCK